jgi:hypothetical protein
MIKREARLGVIPQSRMDLLAELEERVLCSDGGDGDAFAATKDGRKHRTLNIEHRMMVEMCLVS